MNMQRRQFLGAIGALAFPAGSQAQTGPSGKPHTIGWLSAQRRASLDPYLAEVRSGLTELGHVEGKSLTVLYRFGDDDIGKVPAMAADLIAQGVEAIVAQGAAVTVLAGMALPVPLIYVTSGDPVVAGFAESLSRPKGNMTGITFMAAEMNGKRLEILRDIRPGMKTVAVLGNPEHPGAAIEFGFSREKAADLGLEASYHPTRNLAELEAAFQAIGQKPVDAMSVFADGFAVQYRDRIIGFALDRKIPVASGWAVFAQSGALCTYGPRLSSSYRRLSYYIHKVITGSRPADLPIERPSTFELVLNLRTARQMGLTLPTAVIARADDVIE
jgi:putative tryptophan/tyrosine transport system substrate-binding protein